MLPSPALKRQKTVHMGTALPSLPLPVPVYTDIKSAYAAGGTIAELRYAALTTEFRRHFDASPECFARSPGRVNIIGEHVDYSGYSVLPMAIEQDIVIAVSRASDDSKDGMFCLNLANMDSAFPAKTLRLGKNDKRLEIDIDSSSGSWYNYFLCGFKAVIERLNLNFSSHGMNVFVSGTIPPAAGLSSSSAMVCAAAIATIAFAYLDEKLRDELAKQHLTTEELANLCGRYERFVGTEGGGMDQAISLLAKPGYALHITFNPLNSTPVQLPSGCTWMVAHTLVDAHKQKSAATKFNKRVVECRLAASLLAKKLKLPFPPSAPGKNGYTLRDVQELSGKSLHEMITFTELNLHEGPYTISELESAAELGLPVEKYLIGITQARNVIQAEGDGGSYKLFQRALHVFCEALRVEQFVLICEEQISAENPLPTADFIQSLGNLMKESHESCSQMYECSCPELDDLQRACIEGGAVGARLTGAGWGGCVISLVQEDDVNRFRKVIDERYYSQLSESQKKVLSENPGAYIFATKPTGGGCIIMFPS